MHGECSGFELCQLFVQTVFSSQQQSAPHPTALPNLLLPVYLFSVILQLCPGQAFAELPPPATRNMALHQDTFKARGLFPVLPKHLDLGFRSLNEVQLFHFPRCGPWPLPGAVSKGDPVQLPASLGLRSTPAEYAHIIADPDPTGCRRYTPSGNISFWLAAAPWSGSTFSTPVPSQKHVGEQLNGLPLRRSARPFATDHQPPPPAQQAEHRPNSNNPVPRASPRTELRV